jgi:hypothetical protein
MRSNLQCRKIRRAIAIERHDLAVDDAIRKLLGGARNSGNFSVQSRPFRVRSATP